MSRILTIAHCRFRVLGAQAPAPPAAPAGTSGATGRRHQPQPATVTFSGCLKPGASAGSFILADAAPVPATSADASKAEPQARGTTGSAKSYNLMGKTGEDLSKHVNQRIEVTGTVSAAAPSASAPATPPAGGTPQPTENVNMQSFKMVSATCP